MKKAPLFLWPPWPQPPCSPAGHPPSRAAARSRSRGEAGHLDGKQRLKVKRKVRLIASCSKDW